MSGAPLLLEALREHAERRPDAVALRDFHGGGLRCLTFGSLYAACIRLGELLAEAGDGRGALVLEAPGRMETPVAVLAALWAGRPVLPVSAQATPSELAGLVERVGATQAIGSAAFLERLPGSLQHRMAAEEILALEAPREEGRPGPGKTGSLLLQSSGTSGPPKIVCRSVEAVHAVGRNVARALSLSGSDVVLLSIPFQHSYALDMFSAAVVGGCAVEIHESFLPTRVRNSLRESAITVWPTVPVMLDALCRGRAAEAPLSALRHVVSAGSPLPRRVYDQFEAAYGVRVVQIYGASEFGSITCGDPDAPGFDPASVGRPLGGVRLRVEPPGGEGEILVAAPSMMDEYLGEAHALDARGFLPTGDLGRIDDEGRLTLTGRIKLLIDVGGQKVNPIEVEQVLVLHPEVAEAVVVPVPWSDTTERHHAVIVPEPGCSPDPADLRSFALQHLSAYKVPRSFRLRLEVPRSPTGKILRREVRQLEQAPRERA